MAKVSVSKNYKCCCLYFYNEFTNFADFKIYVRPGQDDSLDNAKRFAERNYFGDEVAVYDRFGNYYPIKK